MSSPSIPQKQCTDCLEWFPETDVYFPIYKVRGKRYLRNACRPCWRLGRKKHSDDTREQDRIRRRVWRAANPDKVAAEKRRSHALHRETDLARGKQWHKDHKEHIRQKQQQGYQRNRKAIIERTRLYQKRYPDRVRVVQQNRRAREKNAPGKFTKEDVEVIYKSQRGLCWWCSCELNHKYYIDHRVPLSRGGSNNPENLCLTCAQCNLEKWAKLPSEWSDRLL